MMQVAFLPFTAKWNPYQRALSEALATHGVQVITPESSPLLSLLHRRRYGDLDLVHIHWATPLLLGRYNGESILKSSLLILACLALRVSGVKLVWTVHNLVGHDSNQPGLEIFTRRMLYHVCQQVIVHCPAAVELVAQTYRLPQKVIDKIEIIPPGHLRNLYPNKVTHQAARTRLSLPSGETVWLYFGLIRPYKNVDLLIETFNAMKIYNVRLLIIGRPQDGAIKSEIQRLVGGNDRIQTRLEYIADDEIQIYMNAADLVVLPFRAILNSSSIMLAMSFAKPIITPAIGCSPTLLKQQQQLLYEPTSTSKLTNRLRASLEMDLKQIGKKNLEVAISLPWELSGEQTFRLYRRCLTNKY